MREEAYQGVMTSWVGSDSWIGVNQVRGDKEDSDFKEIQMYTQKD